MEPITKEYIDREYKLALSLLEQSKLDEAETKILNILQYVPNHPEILNFIGRLYQFKGDFTKSIKYLTEANKYDDTNPLIYYNLCLAYTITKNLDKTKWAVDNYIKNSPNNPNRHFTNLYISKLYFDTLDIKQTSKYYVKSQIPIFEQFAKLLIPRIYMSNKEAARYRKEYIDTLDYVIENYKKFQIDDANFLNYLQFTYCYCFPLSYQGRSNAEIFKKQCQMYRLIYPQLNYTSKYLNNYLTKTSEDKINIGFISNHFFNHSVTRDRMGVIRNLPRTQFNVFVFYYSKPNDDLGGFVWDSDNINIVLPDSNIYERRSIIENQKLDILVFCDIGMAPDTQWLSYSRLAPIQLTTWGHSDTSGIDTIDYYMSSSYYEEEWAQENYSEKLLRLDSLCTYYFKIINDPEMVTKDYFNIPTDKKLYLCCQVLFKINPSYDIIIKEILERDSNALFAFIEMNVGSYIQQKIIQRLTPKLGNNINRVIFMKWQTQEKDFYKTLSCADVLVDSIPFGGCNTSFSAFGMGIPIVTFPARLINGRFTYGLYKKMGIMDLVANSNEEYIELAIKVANNAEFRKTISDKILEKNKLIFNEPESVTTWSNTLINLYNNLHKPPIPYIFHFIFFGYTEFLMLHYLAIKSCYDNNPKATINLYYAKSQPNNIWWNRATKYCKLILTPPPESIFNNKLVHFAHKADVVRLENLINTGGIYLDIDVITVKSFEPLLTTTKDCIMGIQALDTQFTGLCNATIIARPQSEFLKKWYDNYKTFDNTVWDYHSVHLPRELSNKYPELIDIKPQEYFFPISWWESEKQKLFTNYNINLKNTYSMHMWESKWIENITKFSPEYFINYNNNITNLLEKNIFDKSNKSILYIGSSGNSGYAMAAKNYIKSLLSAGFNVCFKSLRDEYNNNNEIDDLLLNKLSKNTHLDYDIIICHTPPSFWNNFKQPNKIFIGFFVWETTKIPLEWEPIIKNTEYIIVPSKFTYDIISKYNKNIFIIPHAITDINIKPIKTIEYDNNINKIHSNIYIEKGKPFQLTNDIINNNTFVYYTIGTLEKRKNIELLIELYSKLNLQNIVLYIKSNIWQTDPHVIENKITNFLNSIKCPNTIIFNFDNLPQQEIYNIHKKGSCFINVSYGEGVGLSTAYAAYYKNPVIFNSFGGTTSYIKSYKYIPYEYEKVYDEENILFNNNHQYWAILDYKQTFDRMTELYNNSKQQSEIETNYINESYTYLHNNFNINSISILFDKYINNIINNNSDTINNSIQIINETNHIINTNIKILNNTNTNNSVSPKKSIPFKYISDSEKEILIIGDLTTLQKRMDKNIYNFLNYIKYNSKYKSQIQFITKESSIYKPGMDIFDLIDISCQTNNPIIYHIVYDNPANCLVSNLDKYTGIKIYDIEDSYDVLNIINCIQSGSYTHTIFKYLCPQSNYISNKLPDISYNQISHHIDSSVFNINLISKKDIDILIYGNNSDFYPFRQRLFNLIKNSDIKYFEIPFPGYGDERNPLKYDPIIEKKLAHVINRSKFTICTSSKFDYLLKKYLEVSLCGSIIIGNMPSIDGKLFGDNYISLNDNMTDTEIINIIKKSIINYNDSYYQKKRINAYNICYENYTYKEGCKKFDKLISEL